MRIFPSHSHHKKKKSPSIGQMITICLIIILGAIIYFSNYEIQTINLEELESGETILEYDAPSSDPLPHHLRIIIEAEKTVTLVVETSGTNVRTVKNIIQAGEEKITIYPEEKIVVRIENPNSSDGTVRTELWCDSWNYAASFLIGIGIILLGIILIKNANS